MIFFACSGVRFLSAGGEYRLLLISEKLPCRFRRISAMHCIRKINSLMPVTKSEKCREVSRIRLLRSRLTIFQISRSAHVRQYVFCSDFIKASRQLVCSDPNHVCVSFSKRRITSSWLFKARMPSCPQTQLALLVGHQVSQRANSASCLSVSAI